MKLVDVIYNEDGTETLIYADGSTKTLGTDGDDTIVGTDGDDKLIGAEGDDELYGLAGDDKLIGGDGNDTLQGGEDSDVILAGEGDDLAIYDLSLHDDSDLDFYNGGSGANDTLQIDLRDLSLAEINARGFASASDYKTAIEDFFNLNGNKVDFRDMETGGFNLATKNFENIIILFNNPPEANDQNVSVDEDNQLVMLLDASDPDGDALNFMITSDPLHGTVSIVNGEFTYTPNADYNGPDSFSYKVDDGNGAMDTATVNITVDPVNDDPIAQDKMIITDEDVAANVVLMATDVDGDILSYNVISGPSNGMLTGIGANLTYTPDANYNGADSFTYEVDDGNGGTDTATVDITVNSVNDAPIANDQNVNVNEDAVLMMLLDATDADGDILTYMITSDPLHGTVSIVNGEFTYTPNADYNGPDSFSYKVDDGNGAMDTATVNITVDPVNDEPTAQDQFLNTDEDTAFNFDLDAADIDGDNLTVNVLAVPALGEVVISGVNVTYTPDANANGVDSFFYEVSDGNGGTAGAFVFIDINPVNDAPEAQDKMIETDEDVAVGVVLMATDVEGDILSYNVISGPSNGMLSGTGVNLTYTPDADFNGVDSFIYEVDDGNGGTDTATVEITVNPVNDAPTAQDQSVITNEDTPIAIALDVDDLDGDILTFNLISGPTIGSVSGTGENVTYTPFLNQNGVDSFTYEISDGNGGTATATVDLTVNPVDDGPQWLGSRILTIDEDTSVDVLIATDVDGGPVFLPSFTGPSNGTWTHNGGYNFTYTPNLNYTGVDEITYFPGTFRSITIAVEPVNDAPTVASLAGLSVVEEGAPIAIANVADVDGDNLSVSADLSSFSMLTYTSQDFGGIQTISNLDLTNLLGTGIDLAPKVFIDNGSVMFDPGFGFIDLQDGESAVIAFDIMVSDGTVNIIENISLTVTGSGETISNGDPLATGLGNDLIATLEENGGTYTETSGVNLLIGGSEPVPSGVPTFNSLTGGTDNDVIIGGAGRVQNSLSGGDGDDLLIVKALEPGAGLPASINAILTGGSGADTFAFLTDSRGGITDFEDGIDKINIVDITNNFADVIISPSGATDTLVTFASSNEEITLLGINSADIGMDDFIF